MIDWPVIFWALFHGEAHLRPWEVRRLRFPSELEWALDPERYDPKKPPPDSDAIGEVAVNIHLARRRQMTAAELLEDARRRD